MDKDKFFNDDSSMAAEPMPTYGASRNEAEPLVDTIEDETEDCFSYPGSRSIDDVREHCLHFMEEKNDPSRWMTVEQFDAKMRERFPWWK